MPTDYADYDEQTGSAVVLAATDLTATGLAKESGGNLANVHTDISLGTNPFLHGTVAGALTSTVGKSMAQDMLHANAGTTTEIAALIATGSASGTPGGVPLLAAKTNLFTLTNTSVSTGGTTLGPVPVSQIGYDGVISFGATVGPVYVLLSMEWFDQGTPVATEEWIIACGPSSGTEQQIYLSGPTKGDTLKIFMDTASGTAILNGAISQNSRIYQRDVWLTNAFGLVGLSPIGANMPNGVLASQALGVIAAGGNVSFDLPLWKGKALFSIQNHSGANSGHITIASPGDPSISSAIFAAEYAAAKDASFEVVLPGANCRITVTNDGTTGTNNPSLGAVIEGY